MQGLLTYLENVVSLEKNVYTQTQMIGRIDYTIAQLGISRKLTRKKVEQESLGDTMEVFFGIVAACAIIAAVIGVIIGWSSAAFGFSFRKLISYALKFGLIGAAIGIIPGIIYMYVLKNKEKQESIRLEQDFQNRMAADHRRVEAEHAKANRLSNVRNRIVAQREQTKALLLLYYSKNVLYPTYHNMAAVCSIYEYLKSGRCRQLEGHEGAYNIYEYEKRLERIVEKLDVVIEKLDEIRANQYMLYTAIQEGNRTMHKVLNETYRQTELQSFTAEQSAIAAYNSGVAAQEARLGNWLKTYELTMKGL